MIHPRKTSKFYSTTRTTRRLIRRSPWQRAWRWLTKAALTEETPLEIDMSIIDDDRAVLIVADSNDRVVRVMCMTTVFEHDDGTIRATTVARLADILNELAEAARAVARDNEQTQRES